MSERRREGSSQDSAAPLAAAGRRLADSELGFSFRIIAGRAALTLRNRVFFGWLGVERLELEVPGLEPPVTMPQGPESFQRRRTRVRIATLRIDQRAIDRYVAGRTEGLDQSGFEDLAVRAADGYLAVAARIREGNNTADLTCRFYLAPQGLGVRVVVGSARVYGYLPIPVTLLAHRLGAVLLGAEDSVGQGPAAAQEGHLPTVEGLGHYATEPLHALLWHTLPTAGWRLPSTSSVGLISVRVTRGCIEVNYGPASRQHGGTPEALALIEAGTRLHSADTALRSGDFDGALRAYRGELAARGTDQPLVIERILAVSAADPTLFSGAAELARQTLAYRPDFAAAHVAIANIAAVQADARTASIHYQHLVELAGDDEEAAIRAALAGARLVRITQPDAAAILYERVLERAPAHLEASAALLERYKAEGRWHDVIKLIRSRSAARIDKGQQSRDHLRVAEIMRQKLDDLKGARVEVEKACQLDPHNVKAFDALADLDIAEGKEQVALETLDHVAELWADRGDVGAQIRTHVRSAALCEHLGNRELADAHYRVALELEPSNIDALVGAASAAAKRGEHRRAIELWNKLLRRPDHPPRHQARYQLELGRSLLATGDVAPAKELLTAAADQGSSGTSGEAHSLLADLHKGNSDLGGAAAELDAAVVSLTRAAEAVFAHSTAEIPIGADAIIEQESSEDYAEGKRYLGHAAELALQRALLLNQMGLEDDAREDYQRAHTLARDVDPEKARVAARALLEVEERRGDRRAQRRWIDALLAAQPERGERVGLLLSRAQLRAFDPNDAEGALRDLDTVISEEPDDEKKAIALGLQARLLAAAGDRGGKASSLAERAALVRTPMARAEAETAAAEAWLEAEDSSAALAAAHRAVDEIDRALEAGIAIHPETRERSLVLLGDLAWRHREWQSVARCYRELLALGDADGTGSGTGTMDQIRYAYRLGMALDGLGERDGAIEALQRVLTSEAAPGDVRTTVWRSLAKLYERAGELLLAARIYESLAADTQAKAGRDSRTEAWYRAGELYRKTKSHDADAERCLEGALALAADHMPALDALERIKRAQGDDERVASILDRKLAVADHNPAQKKALLARLAQLQHERLGQPEVALESYRRALEIDGEFRPALRFVAAAALRKGNIEEAAEAYDSLSRALSGDADLPEQHAELLEERIASAETLAELAMRPDSRSDIGKRLLARARNAVVALLADAPGNRTLQALIEIFDAVERGEDAVVESVDTVDSSPLAVAVDRSSALQELAEKARASGDLEAAISYLDQALEAAPRDANLLRDRADVAAESGDYQGYAKWLEVLLDAPPKIPGRSKLRRRIRRAEIYLELADIFYDYLDDRTRARDYMRSAAEAYGTGSRCDATLRILAAEAAAGQADDVAAEAYESIEPGRRSAADRFNLANAYHRLGADHRAVAELEAAEAADVLTHQGARLLFRLRQEMASKAERAAALEARSNGAPPERATAMLEEALELYEEALGDNKGAQRVRAFLAAIARTGSARSEAASRETAPAPPETAPAPPPTSPREVDAIRPEAKSEKGGLRVLERPSPDARRTATTTTPGLGLPSTARKRSRRSTGSGLKRVVAPEEVTDPRVLEKAAQTAISSGNHKEAAEYLARVIVLRTAKLDNGRGLDAPTRAAVERLRKAAEASQAWDDLVTGLSAAAEAENTPAIVSALWGEVARVLRESLGEPERSARALMRAIEATPGEADLIIEADSLLRQLGDAAALVRVYELHVATLEGQRRARPLFELGRIYRDALGQADRAEDYFVQAHRADVDFADVWLPLANLRAAREETDEALRLYEMALERGNPDPDTRVFLENTIETLAADRGPASKPGHSPAPVDDGYDELLAEGAELEAHGQWQAAIATYETASRDRKNDHRPLEALIRLYSVRDAHDALLKTLERLTSITHDRHARARLRFRQAMMYRDIFHDEAETYRCLTEAHANDPDNGDIAYELRCFAIARSEWALAAELLYREIEAAEDPRESGALHFELALIYDEKLVDGRQARINYEQALELDPDIPAAPRPLARLYEMEGLFARAAQMNELASKHVRDDGDRSDLLQRAAACAERAGKLDDARRLYQLAVVAAVDNDDRRATAKSALARLAKADPTASRSEEASSGRRGSKGERRRLKALIDEAIASDDRKRAADHARALLNLDATDALAFAVLKQNAESRGDWVALAELLETRAGALSEPTEKAQTSYELAHLAATRLGAVSAAVAGYERALRAAPGHQQALEELAELVYEQQDWQRAEPLYATLDGQSSSFSSEVLAYRRGVIAEGLGHDRAALAAFTEVARIAPNNRTALAAMGRIAMKLGDMRASIEASEALLRLLPLSDVQAISAARLMLAELHQRAGNSEAAIHYNELVLSENRRSQPALRALAKLYVEARRFEDAAKTLNTLVSLTTSLPRRAELLYRLGELCRDGLKDIERANDAYLKGIDLDPGHIPTLRRLVDYYWQEDEPDELLEIVAALVEQSALVDDETDDVTLARALIAAAIRERIELITRIGDWLGERTVGVLVSVLVEAARHEGQQTSIQTLAEAVLTICEAIPDLTPESLAERFTASDQRDSTRKLAAALRTVHSLRERRS